MAVVAWRFQCDPALGETDPMVTVFVGDTFTNDETGERTVQHDTTNPASVKLSELPAFLAAPVKAAPPKMPGE